MRGNRNVLTPNYIIGEDIIGKADNAKATDVGRANNACKSKELDTDIEELRGKYREMIKAERASAYNNADDGVSDMMKRYRAEKRAEQTKTKKEPMTIETFDVIFWILLTFITAGFALLLMPLYIWAKKYRMEHPLNMVDKNDEDIMRAINSMKSGAGAGIEHGVLDTTGIHPASIFRN